ncbi:MAG: AAA family ATPase [Magnetococcales bacterium]|nr:AAA family ATPase [Magnetococcales bacterium]
MYLKKITLRNIRGFKELDFDLERPGNQYAGWTVFTGGNGSGKSTLLKAVALCLVGCDTARSLLPDFNGWIRKGAEQEVSFIQLDIVRIGMDDYVTQAVYPQNDLIKMEVVFKHNERHTNIQNILPMSIDGFILRQNPHGWFSCGYGPFRRMFGASTEAVRQMVSPTTERFVTMFHEAASLAEADQWLKTLKHKTLEGRQEETDLLKLILEILSDALLPNDVVLDRVDSDGLWLKDRGGTRLSWSDMSDGFRSVLALMVDILRHLVNAYGIRDLYDRGGDGEIRIKRSGVILIDEIDAHLHPSWQQEIGFWLKRHFPKIQFLVTSHSPLVCQAADQNGIFVLPDDDDSPPGPITPLDHARIIASRPDTILLSPAFGLQNTRSGQAVAWRAEWSALDAKKRVGGALTADELEKWEKWKNWPFDDEEG